MPTYEYRCPEGHTFELFQKMSEEPVAACPECGRTARRVISGGAGFLFKGEGFYITDYRSEEYRKRARAEKGGPGGDGAKKGGGGDDGGGSGGGGAASEGTGSGGSGASGSSGGSPAGGGDG